MKVPMLSPYVPLIVKASIPSATLVCPQCLARHEEIRVSRNWPVDWRRESRILTFFYPSYLSQFPCEGHFIRITQVVRTFSNPHRKKASPAQDPSQNREAVQLLWV
jgi:hypothetical protein